jgi:hypothetical protein
MDIKLPTEADFKALIKIRKYLYLPILALIVVIVLSIFVLIPRVGEIIRLREEVHESNEELFSLEEKVAFLENLDEASLLERLDLLEKVLPSQKAVVGWVQTIRGLSEATGIDVGQLSFKPGSIATGSASPSATPREGVEKVTKIDARRSSDSVDSFSLKFEIESSFASLVDFLSRFDDISPLIKITALSMVPSRESQQIIASNGEVDLISVRADITVLLFYTSNPEKLGAVGDKVLPLNDSELELYEEMLSFREYEPATASSVTVGREDVFAPF